MARTQSGSRFELDSVRRKLCSDAVGRIERMKARLKFARTLLENAQFNKRALENRLIRLRLAMPNRPDDRTLQRRIDQLAADKEGVVIQIENARDEISRLESELAALFQRFDGNQCSLEFDRP